MSYKTITTILNDPSSVATRLDAACAVARAHDAHLQVIALGTGVDYPIAMHASIEAGQYDVSMAQSTETAEEITDQAEAYLTAQDIRWDIEAIAALTSTASQLALQHLRFSDLVVQSRPLLGQQELAETVLFHAECPLLVLPEQEPLVAQPRAVMLGWDESPTAMRTTRLALPFLKTANAVYIGMVDPTKDALDRSDPGGAMAQFLSRHGVKCEITVIARGSEGIAKTLEQRSIELGCELLVMGAYGHSRLRQAIFGGVTRDLLTQSRLPVLMAH